MPWGPLAVPFWIRSYTGSRADAADLKNLTSELIGRFVSSVAQATREVYGQGRLTRYGADLVIPEATAAEILVLKGITARYVMTREGVAAAQARERELLTELAHAVERGAPQTLDPLFRPAWDQAVRDGSDAARRRVIIDQGCSRARRCATSWPHASTSRST